MDIRAVAPIAIAHPWLEMGPPLANHPKMNATSACRALSLGRIARADLVAVVVLVPFALGTFRAGTLALTHFGQLHEMDEPPNAFLSTGSNLPLLASLRHRTTLFCRPNANPSATSCSVSACST
jgi:hypothetical protein